MSKNVSIAIVVVVLALAVGATLTVFYSESVSTMLLEFKTGDVATPVAKEAEQNPITKVAEGAAGTSQTDGYVPPIKFLPIKYHGEGYDILISKVQHALNSQAADVLITPEYSLGHWPREVAVRINENDFGHYEIESIGTTESNEVYNKVAILKGFAAQYNTNIVLGTVLERKEFPDVPEEEKYLTTALIIDRNGDIINIHRKYFDGYSPVVEQEIVDTIQAVELTTREGVPFTIFPVICGERNREAFLNYADEAVDDVDVIAYMEAEGDTFYEYLMVGIQDDTFDPDHIPWPDQLEEYLTGSNAWYDNFVCRRTECEHFGLGRCYNACIGGGYRGGYYYFTLTFWWGSSWT